MVVGAGDLDRSLVTVGLVFEKWIQHLEHHRFNPVRSLGNLGLGFQGSMKINFLADQVVGSLHLRPCARHPEGKIGERGNTISKENVTL